MFSNRVQAIVLAAGKSTRFNTGRTKLLEKICGQEMILYTTRLIRTIKHSDYRSGWLSKRCDTKK